MAEAVVLIDIQAGFDHPIWERRSNPGTEDNAARLPSAWRRKDRPWSDIRHESMQPGYPLGPETGGTAFKTLIATCADERS